MTAGLVALVYGIVRTEQYGWGSAQALVPVAVGLGLIALFLVIEGRLAKAPLMPLRIFASRTLTGANLVVFLLGASMFGMWFFVSLYLQQVLGYSPVQAGLAFLPMTVTIIVGSTFASRGVTRFGPKALLVAGMSCRRSACCCSRPSRRRAAGGRRRRTRARRPRTARAGRRRRSGGSRPRW